MNKLNIANNTDKLSIIDLIYPVGSTYLTFDSSFDPNIQWGGVWSKVKSGRCLWIDDEPGKEIEAGLPNITGGGMT